MILSGNSRRRAALVLVGALLLSTLAVVGIRLLAGEPDAPVTKLELSNADQKSLAAFGYGVIDRHFDSTLSEPALAKVSLEADAYDRLFVTLLSHGKIRCSWGSGNERGSNRLAADVTSAVTRCLKDTRFGGELSKEEAKDADLVFNFLYGKRRVAKNDLKYQRQHIELGIHALELKAGKQTAFFKESVAISKNYSLKTLLEKLCLKAKKAKNCAQTRGVQLFKCETTTFKTSRAIDPIGLYRYNTLVNAEDVTQARVKESIALAGHWFNANINPTSRLLEYEYLPSADKYSSTNNDVRRLGALWSMTEIDQFLGQQAFSKAVADTFAHYFKGLKRGGQAVAASQVAPSDVVLLMPNGDGKIAFNAFAIYSLINSPSYPNRDALMRALGNGIVAQQRADGSLRTFFDSEKKGGEDFYPGEALFALAWLYREVKDERYLEVVKKAFPFYRSYWRANKTTAFVPWHSRADRILYEATKDAEVADFIFEMQDFIWKEQVKEHRHPDILGGLGQHPHMSTCTHAEGLGDAHQVAKLAANSRREAELGDTLKRAGRFMLQLQYTEENLFYLTNPKRALGGFRGTLTNNVQRNDYSQHCVLGLLKLAESELID